jgi:phosphohistidine phosphatase SixA
LTFEQDGFNEVDNLIMSSLAYLEFDGIAPSRTNRNAVSLSDIEKQNSAQIDTFALLGHNPLFKRLPELFHKAARSQRYCGVKLSGYVNKINQKQSEQFSAVIFP